MQAYGAELIEYGHDSTDTHQVAEGAAALPLAAALKEKSLISSNRIGLVLTGGNVDAKIYQRILKL